jgi:uncharacterized membrane protein (DUF4010 family)
MDPAHALITLGIALGLGLLVGLQRERADSALAGIRTFPLITVLGAVCAMLTEAIGGWVVGAGVIGVAAASFSGNLLRPRTDASPGITTEIAALLMFGVGCLLATMPYQIGTAVGVACAILLHLKDGMHAFAGRLDERDMRAIMQFCAVTFIVLPVLPDRTFGPLGVLNPRQIWWMVVLVVSISLLGYVMLKLARGRTGALLGGLVGGLVSSTATTVTFSKRAAEAQGAIAASLLAIVVASGVVFGRVIVEMSVVAPKSIGALAGPFLAMLLIAVVVSAGVWLICRRQTQELPESSNPTELKSALIFAGLYAIVVLAVAIARKYFGEQGLYVVAVISGLTDMDAITLSTAKLVEAESVSAEIGWRSILVASAANLVFKLGLCIWLGGRRFALPATLALGAIVAASCIVLWLWPDDLVLPVGALMDQAVTRE